MSKNALDFIVVKSPSVASTYKTGNKPSFSTFIEDYVNQRVDLNGNFEEFMSVRNTFFDYTLTGHHLKFLTTRFIPEVLIHSKAQDERIIRDHYDRGNDFFSSFLGPRMIYTSGFFHDLNESLEVAQDRKMQMVCSKLNMKAGNSHLDIGCGWGTLVTYAAKHFGTYSTGVTIAQDGKDSGDRRAAENGVSDRAKYIRQDYRDIDPNKKYDHITCLEMGEHVGIRKFQRFINQIYSLLDDNGTFYIQQAGLRANTGFWTKGQHWEDLCWGMFMNEYIFSGADASTPLAFLTQCLQDANFEVQNVENVGIHYSHTIQHWYNNWMTNEEFITGKYGVWWFRMWQVFLKWSVIVAGQGSSTCWAITAYKNLNSFDRNQWIGRANLGSRMNLETPITL